MKVRIPHPCVNQMTVRHCAGGSALIATSVQFLQLPHLLEPALFGISAVLAIYEPQIISYFHQDHIGVPDLEDEDGDDYSP